MKVNIEFDLNDCENDDKSKLMECLFADHNFSLLEDVAQYCRNKLKHGSEEEISAHKVLEDIQDIVSGRSVY